MKFNIVDKIKMKRCSTKNKEEQDFHEVVWMV